jgi:hypothetical protein
MNSTDTPGDDLSPPIAQAALEALDSMASVIGKLEAIEHGQRTLLERSLLQTNQALAAATTCLELLKSNRADAAELLGKFEEMLDRLGGDWDGDGGEQILARKVRAGLSELAGCAAPAA